MGGVRVMVSYPLNVWVMIVVRHPPLQRNLFMKSKFGVLSAPPIPQNVTDLSVAETVLHNNAIGFV